MPASSQRKAEGTYGEGLFRQWLEESEVPFTYFEQSKSYFPRRLKDKIKRPDFLIGIIGIGSLAIDVKHLAYFRKEDCYEIKDDEVIRLANYQRYFNITVMYAIIPKENHEQCYLIANDMFLHAPKLRYRDSDGVYKTVRRVKRLKEDLYYLNEDFMAAFAKQINMKEPLS